MHARASEAAASAEPERRRRKEKGKIHTRLKVERRRRRRGGRGPSLSLSLFRFQDTTTFESTSLLLLPELNSLYRDIHPDLTAAGHVSAHRLFSSEVFLLPSSLPFSLSFCVRCWLAGWLPGLAKAWLGLFGALREKKRPEKRRKEGKGRLWAWLPSSLLLSCFSSSSFLRAAAMLERERERKIPL